MIIRASLNINNMTAMKLFSIHIIGTITSYLLISVYSAHSFACHDVLSVGKQLHSGFTTQL